MHPKKRLLYIGNKLEAHGKPPTTIDRLPQKLEQEGHIVFTASSKKNKIIRILHMAFATIKYRKRVDLVLIDTYSTQNFQYAVAVAALCRVFKISYIPILHGGNLPHRLKNNKRLSQNLFGNAKTNVAPSKYLFEKFKRHGFENLTHIPNAIEIEQYPYRQREWAKPKLLWVRSFSEIYNPILALKIVEILKSKGMEVSLCMVGPDKDGSLQRCKKMATELNLPVTFTGILSKKEWISLSAEFNIFINTTNFDNMPVSVMEAMALGMPVVSTNVGGLPFLIESGNDGILVQPNHAEGFVAAIENLCENYSTAAAISKNAREKMEGYDWHKIKDYWTKLLDG